MKRRDFLALAAAAAAFPRSPLAQQATKMPSVVYLAPAASLSQKQALWQGLADYGYVDGRNVAVEFVEAGTVEALPAAAARIVASGPSILVPNGVNAALAARNATSTIPIVFVNVGDPVGVGLIPSLARPGGNLTGTSGLFTELVGKQISILREIIPSLRRMAVLYLPSSPPIARTTEQIRLAALAVGVEPVLVGFAESSVAEQFEAVIATRADAAFVTSNQFFNIVVNLNTFRDLLIKAKLPAIAQQTYPSAAHPVLGVVAYGPSTTAGTRRAGSFIDAILRGARPGDLPAELPTVFDFAVDLAAAKAIGITIPASILAQATQVLE